MKRTAVECLAVLAVALVTMPVLADSPVSYVNSHDIEIPFRLTPGKAVSEVHLHVSRDGKSFSAYANVEPTKRVFDYKAKEDGLHYFVVQTRDTFGQLEPPTVSGAVGPSLRLVVDTALPKIEFRAVEPREGSAAVEWEVSDPNLDLRSLRLEYRVVEAGRWIQLNPEKLDRAHFNWNPPGTGMIEVRLTVADLARNVSSQTVQLKPIPGKEPVPRIAAPGMPRVIHVRNKTFKLNYRIDGEGPSKTKHLEVWMTRDTRAWQKLSVVEEEHLNQPVPLSVVAAGRYGFTLRPVSGVGRAIDPPALGQSPQIWVEVDETAPEVQLLDVKVGEGPDAGYVMVSYRALDKWLREAPITLYGGPTKDGPWDPIENNQLNSGNLKLSTKGRPFQFYLKLEATDEAGNKGSAVWPDSVKVDLSRPEVKDLSIIGVEGGSPAPATPPPSPPEGLPGSIPPG